MKNILVAFFVISVVAFGMLTYGYIKATPGAGDPRGPLPVIEVTPNFFDFGEIAYGDVAKYTFTLKNAGNQPLEIKRISTSCACTTAKAATAILVPGQETELTITYDSGAMSGPHGKGEQERIIYIQSNDPMRPQVEITIYARVN